MTRVAVIGGGVIGLGCAYELARRGLEVTVLDRGRPREASSWGNAGYVVPSHAGPMPAPGLMGTSLRWMLRSDSPLYINPLALPVLGGWLWRFWRHCNPPAFDAGLKAMVDLSRRTLEQYDELAADVPFELHRRGVLYVFLSQGALQGALQELRAQQPEGGGELEVLSRRDLRDLEPALSARVAGGIYVRRERHLRPESLLQGLRIRLDQLGVTRVEGAEVTGFLTSRRRDRGGTGSGAGATKRVAAVDTARGPLEADAWVLAAGAWSGAVARDLGLRLPVQAGKGYSITYERAPVPLQHPVYLGESKAVTSPFDGALRLAGTMELSGINLRQDHRRLEGLRQAAGRYFSEWDDTVTGEPWVGMRPITPDGLPLIGRLPGWDNAFIATGHGTLGVTLAPVTAVALADLMTGGDPEVDLTPFDPGRF